MSTQGFRLDPSLFKLSPTALRKKYESATPEERVRLGFIRRATGQEFTDASQPPGAPADFGGAVYTSAVPPVVSDDTDPGIPVTRMPTGVTLQKQNASGALPLKISNPPSAELAAPGIRTIAAQMGQAQTATPPLPQGYTLDALPPLPQGYSLDAEKTAEPPSAWDKVAHGADELTAPINPVSILQGMAQLTAHPIDTYVADAAVRQQILDKAKASFKNGDYAEGVAHALYSMLPFVGRGLDRSGEQFKSGDIVGGTASSIGQGIAMAGPALLPKGISALSEAVDRIPSSTGKAVVTAPVRYAARGAEAAINQKLVPAKPLLNIMTPADEAEAAQIKVPGRDYGLPKPQAAPVPAEVPALPKGYVLDAPVAPQAALKVAGPPSVNELIRQGEIAAGRKLTPSELMTGARNAVPNESSAPHGDLPIVQSQKYAGPLSTKALEAIKDNPQYPEAVRSAARDVHSQTVDSGWKVSDAMQVHGTPELARALGGKMEQTLNADSADWNTPKSAPKITPANVQQQLSDALGGRPLQPGVPLRNQLQAAIDAKSLPKDFTPVESSALKGFKYDPATREFESITQGGQRYIHGDVSPEEAQSFADAKSKGQAWQRIRDNPLVGKVVNGKRIAVKPLSALSSSAPDLTTDWSKALDDLKAKQATEGDRRVSDQPTAIDQRNIDRRTDMLNRKRVSALSEDEAKQELMTSSLTGLPNERAFYEKPPSKYVAMSDADGMKAFNDTHGHDAGDALIKAHAQALREAGVDAYHQKGDEFIYRGDSHGALKSGLEKARQIFRNSEFTVTTKSGAVKTFKGTDFSYGIGKELIDAENSLGGAKAARKAAGTASERGDVRGIVEK